MQYIEGLRLDQLSSDPGSPVEGQVWYNTTDKRVRAMCDSEVVDLASFKSGTAASRPAAGFGGRFYFATDTGVLSRDNGTSWEDIGGYTHPNHTGDVTSVGDGAQTIADNAVTNAKAADMAANTVKVRNAGTTGNPSDAAVGDLTEETTPAAGDFLLGWESGGALRKFDVGDLPGSGGASQAFTAQMHNNVAKSTVSATYEAQIQWPFLGSTALGTPTGIKVTGEVAGGTTSKVRVYDVTNSQVICELTGISNTTAQVLDLGTLSNVPTGAAVWELQSAGTGSLAIYVSGVSIDF